MTTIKKVDTCLHMRCHQNSSVNLVVKTDWPDSLKNSNRNHNFFLMAYLTLVIFVDMYWYWNERSIVSMKYSKFLNLSWKYFDITFTRVSIKYLKVLSLNNILNFKLFELIQTFSGPNETTTKGYILLEAWTRPSLKKEMHQNAMPFHAIGSS